MARKKKARGKSSGKVVNAGDRVALQARAVAVDTSLAEYLETVNLSFVEMSKLLAEVRDKKLWLYLPDPRPKSPGFKNIKDYGNYRFGKMGRSRVYELIAIGSLMDGPHALSDGTIRKLGPKKAAALARMEPEKRTAEFVDKATSITFAEVEAMVQESINEDLPEDERREVTVTFARTIAMSVAAEMEKLEAIGINMQGIRDADRSVSLVSKFWGCAVIAMRHYFAEDLVEAERFMSCTVCQGQRGCVPGESRLLNGVKICELCLTDKLRQEKADAEKEKVAAAKPGKAKAEESKTNGQGSSEDVFPDYENESQARGSRHHGSARP